MVPLYEIGEQEKMKEFCCGCAWLRLPHNENEKAAEQEWYQNWKKELERKLVERYQQRIKKFLNTRDN